MALGPLESRLRQVQERLTRLSDTEELVNFSGRIDIVDDARADALRFGGMLNPLLRDYTGGAPAPAVRWQIGSQQLPPLQFYEGDSGARFVLCGAMGAGKTELLVRAAAKFGTEFRNASIGMVAPTRPMLGTVWSKFLRIIPSEWVLSASTRPELEPPYVLLKNGVKFQFLAAQAQSKRGGSPIHGFDWVAAFIDEEQKIDAEAMADILARGRDAPDGWYPVLSTCTISDDPAFRARLAKYHAEDDVTVYPMAITANPWVEDAFIEQLRQQYTPRQFRQRVLALEEPPERATYPHFKRDVHVRSRPDIGTIDVTRHITGADYLIGYDPGELCDVSVVLKCYELRGRRMWWVLGELTTEQTTYDEHAVALVDYLNTQFRAHYIITQPDGSLVLDTTEPQVIIRADPHGTSEGRPDVTVYRHFRKYLFNIHPAQYKRTTNPAQASRPGTLQRNARIDCVNTLLMNAAGESRLFLLPDSRGYPIAERLATSLEMSQRDEYGRAEQQRKDVRDLSHWTTALGFALWPYEKVRPSPPGAEAFAG